MGSDGKDIKQLVSWIELYLEITVWFVGAILVQFFQFLLLPYTQGTGLVSITYVYLLHMCMYPNSNFAVNPLLLQLQSNL